MKTATYTITQNGEYVASFNGYHEAEKFCEDYTETNRFIELTLEDRAGWVTEYFANGYKA